MSQQIFQVRGVETREVPVEEFLERERQHRAAVEASIIRPVVRESAPPDIDGLLADVRGAVIAAQAAQRDLDTAEEAVARASQDYDTATALLRELIEMEGQHITALASAKHAWYAGGCVGSRPEISPSADVSAGRAERATLEGEQLACDQVLHELGDERDRARDAADRAMAARNAAAKRVIAAEATDKALRYFDLIEEAEALYTELQITALQHLPTEPGRPAGPLMFDPMTADCVNSPRHVIDHRNVAAPAVVARTRAVADAVRARFDELTNPPPEVEATVE